MIYNYPVGEKEVKPPMKEEKKVSLEDVREESVR